MELVIYDPYEEFPEGFGLRSTPLLHLASDLAVSYGYIEKTDLEIALTQALDLCLIMNIPISEHFRKVYVYENASLHTDWLVSDFGSYLLLINGDVHNPLVAKARLYVFSKSVA